MKIFLLFTEINQKFGPLYYQHGLASISALLKKHGFTSISLIHIDSESALPKWQSYINKHKPDILGIYSTTEQFPYIKKLIENIHKDIFTICGGPHPTCNPMCIKDLSRLDAVCIGEGEYPMLELTTALKHGRDHLKIKNLWFRDRSRILKNDTRLFTETLDVLPFEDRELFRLQQSIDRYGLGQVRVMTSRGCPYHCTYCANKHIGSSQPGQYFRLRPVGHIMDELLALNQKYRFDEVFFDDDIFMADPATRKEFCKRYKEDIGKPFVFCGHIDRCSEEMLKDLKNAGGRRIDFGIESGNEGLRRKILKRNMTNEKIIHITKIAKRVGLQVKTLNMVGLPEETAEKHMDTVMLNRKIQPDVASIFVFYPYPGTELYKYCINKSYFDPDKPIPEGYVSRRSPLLDLPCFSKSEITRCFERFGFRIYRKSSLKKALLYTALYSSYGEMLMKITARLRNILVRLFPGF